MPFLESIFTCNSTDNKEDNINNEIKGDIINVKSQLALVKQDIDNLYRDNNIFKNDVKNLEIKLDFKFDNLNSKIDNILLLLTTKQIKN